MAKTQMGAFEHTYHHIDAPTYQDDEYGREHKKRILINPLDERFYETPYDEIYRSEELSYLNSCTWTTKRKVDGENIRIYWDGEQALWNGKTNKFNCNADFQQYMNDTFIEEIFEERFGHDKEVYIYGEKMGPKTQGNELGLDKDELVIFDVEINGTFVKPDVVDYIARYFNARTVGDFMNESGNRSTGRAAEYYGLFTLDECIDRVVNGEYQDWEGIVCSPVTNIKDHNGHRIIVKIKNKDYNPNWRKK